VRKGLLDDSAVGVLDRVKAVEGKATGSDGEQSRAYVDKYFPSNPQF
jgi:hypothetical protein